MFLLGGYVVGVLFTFMVTTFFCILGGRNQDMWKPFAIAALWFILVPWYVVRRLW